MKQDIFFDESFLPEEERWENLTIANDFMFGKIFQDPDLCLHLVRLILPELNIERVSFPVLQKSVRETFDTKGVRFDVYLYDDKDRIINVEMQPVKRDDLMKRTRAYHSLIDLDAMDRQNVKRYADMPEVIVIFICGFDLFKLGRHMYTFRNFCVQERDLMLDDGAATIFLNAKGKADDVSPELKAFLELVNGRSSDDEFVRELERRLSYARQNKNWRQIYMLGKFEKQANIDEGIERGLKQGLKQGLEEGRKLGLEQGREQGREQGLAQGLEQGRAEGMKLAREELIRNFLDAISEKPWVTLDDIADMEEILMKS